MESAYQSVLPSSHVGLHELSRVTLESPYAEVLASLEPTLLGTPTWVARKRVELRELALLALRCAVPCLTPGDADIHVEHEARLVVTYPDAILRGPLPGTGLVQIVEPQRVHHPNVGSGEAFGPLDPGTFAAQPLCLGARIPRGLPLREALLMSYAALTLQSVQLDERDAAGVMNVEAARFYQHNPHHIPLSQETFLGDAS
jgi:hypothetical protein